MGSTVMRYIGRGDITEAGLGQCLDKQACAEFHEIIGESPALRSALDLVSVVSPTDSRVLIVGETGTGKELIARAIHSLSSRRDRKASGSLSTARSRRSMVSLIRLVTSAASRGIDCQTTASCRTTDSFS